VIILPRVTRFDQLAGKIDFVAGQTVAMAIKLPQPVSANDARDLLKAVY
jgi:hypothetical protein